MDPIAPLKQRFLTLSLQVIAFMQVRASRWEAIAIFWFRGYASLR